MGFIYIIKNKINNKAYIGQTIHSIEIRFKQHIHFSKNGTTKLSHAMRELGVENFYIEELLKVDDNSKLNEYENSYMIEYDSISNGYNSVPAIGSSIRYRTIDNELDDIVSDFLGGMTMTDLGIKYDQSPTVLYRLLREYNIKREFYHSRYYGGKKSVVMYSIEDFEPLEVFDSKNDAYKWLKCNSEFEAHKGHVYHYLVEACNKGNIAFGYRWQLFNDLVLDDKVFRSKFDKEAYLSGAECHLDDGCNYYIVDSAIDKILERYGGTKVEYRCKDCGKIISKGAVRCKECSNKQRDVDTNRISKDELKELLDNEYSYEQIGRMCGVSGKAIRKWSDKYGLTKEIQKHTKAIICCKELKKEFSTLKEAAEYLVNNNLIDAKDIRSIAYRISKKLNNGKMYGLTWTTKQ